MQQQVKYYPVTKDGGATYQDAIFGTKDQIESIIEMSHKNNPHQPIVLE